jgi:protein-tyrosine phosphatase
LCVWATFAAHLWLKLFLSIRSGKKGFTGFLEVYDLILTMDTSNYRNVMSLRNSPEYGHKIFLMRDFDPDDKGAEVPDPYYGGEKGFQEVFEILSRSMEELIQHLEKERSSKKEKSE